MSAQWQHNDLMHDLAEHLRRNSDRMVWTDMQLGPVGSPRPDVFTVNKSYTQPRPLSYEIKISRADFRSDVTSGKWQKYLDYSAGVIFACPASLVSRPDIPAGCGLIVRSDQGWRVAKGPTLRPVKLPESAMLKLLIDGVDRLRTPAQPRRADAFTLAHSQRNSRAADVARYLHDLDGLRALIEQERARLDAQHAAHRARMDVDKGDDRRCREALAKFLGLRPTCPVESLLDVLESHQRSDATELLRALDDIRRIAGRYAGVTI